MNRFMIRDFLYNLFHWNPIVSEEYIQYGQPCQFCRWCTGKSDLTVDEWGDWPATLWCIFYQRRMPYSAEACPQYICNLGPFKGLTTTEGS